MTFRFIHFSKDWKWLSLMFLLFLTGGAQSAPLRVTTWNLQPSAIAGTNGLSAQYQHNLIQEAAETLRKLNPDVILLQQVMDSQSCAELANALKPESYNVTVCSSLRNASNSLSSGQVAILAKAQPYVTWSNAWVSSGQYRAAPGGIAFAAIQIDGKNIGFFSLQLSDGSAPNFDRDSAAPRQRAREESTRQLLQLINSLGNWPSNRLQTLVVAGDLNTTTDDVRFVREKTISRLEQFGFEDVFADLPLEKRVTLPANGTHPDATMDYLFTRDAGMVLNPQTSEAALTEHWAVTGDLDLNAAIQPPVLPAIAGVPPKIPVAINQTNRVTAPSAPDSKPARATAAPGNPAEPKWEKWGVMAGASLLVLLVGVFGLLHVRLKRRKSINHITNQLVVVPHAVPVSNPVRTHFVAEMNQWLKTRIVQRLFSDHVQLLEAQRAASLTVLAMDERLAKLEQQINERNREYEQRIDALLNELAEVKEENQELIHAKIALLKVEMEKKTRQQALRA